VAIEANAAPSNVMCVLRVKDLAPHEYMREMRTRSITGRSKAKKKSEASKAYAVNRLKSEIRSSFHTTAIVRAERRTSSAVGGGAPTPQKRSTRVSFVSILQKIGMIAGQAAPQIISVVSPPLGSIVSTILNSILITEAKIGPGRGDQKKQDALSAVQVAVPLILQLVRSSTGKELADEKRLMEGIDKLNDGLVDVLNAFSLLPRTTESRA
jgi:hypothetical protein